MIPFIVFCVNIWAILGRFLIPQRNPAGAAFRGFHKCKIFPMLCDHNRLTIIPLFLVSRLSVIPLPLEIFIPCLNRPTDF